jgi:hypothetical protein
VKLKRSLPRLDTYLPHMSSTVPTTIPAMAGLLNCDPVRAGVAIVRATQRCARSCHSCPLPRFSDGWLRGFRSLFFEFGWCGLTPFELLWHFGTYLQANFSFLHFWVLKRRWGSHR